MSAQIERDFEFLAGVYFEGRFMVNMYEFTLNMDVNTDSMHEQNIAMDRIKFMIYEVFDNAVFVAESEKKVIEKYKDAGLNVCIIPEEPYDQIIALLLMLKFEAISENKLNMFDIVLTSKLSDEVRFKEDIVIAQATYPMQGWWNDSSPSLTCNVKSKNKKEKVVKLVSTNEWNDLGLSWKEKKETTNEIMFTSEILEK
jgi:hypothetical protein